MLLVGWSDASSTFDDEDRPDPLARAVIAALTSVGRVTFPCSELEAPSPARGWSNVGSDQLTVVARSASKVTRLLHSLDGSPTTLPLLCTTQPDSAFRMFDDGTYFWSLQGQFALLSPLEKDPPNLDQTFGSLMQLFEPSWTDALSPLLERGVSAIVKPGVDGDVLAVLSGTAEFDGDVLAAVARVAQQDGLACEVVDEKEFMDALSG